MSHKTHLYLIATPAPVKSTGQQRGISVYNAFIDKQVSLEF